MHRRPSTSLRAPRAPVEGRRFAAAAAAAAAIILSAPFVQQAFTAAATAWGPRFRPIAISATAVPVGVALLAVLLRIRERRRVRYVALASGFAIGASYVLVNALSFAESFHFVEYGVLAWLFYRACRTLEDGSVVVLPLLAGLVVGTLDEWFQWFIPIRAGEARDIVLNAVASGCGLLFAIAADPRAPTLAVRPESRRRVAAWGATAIVVFVLFFLTVHVGHDVLDPEIGVFRSRFTAAQLERLARDRAERWQLRPPLEQRRLSREDQYLTEGLWHVQRRNQAWNDGDVATAWRENLILEKFYVPILDTPTYAGASGQRWPAEQAAEAAGRSGVERVPSVSDAYPYPLYVWPGVW